MAHMRIFCLICALLCASFFPSPAWAKVWDAYSIVDHPANNMCALTFDDGPSHLTAQFLDALKEEDVHVTFFVLGMQAATFPDIIKRMLREGHEVASHGYAHDNLKLLSPEAAYADLKKTYDILQKLGATPRFLRPPYGRYNKNVISVAKQLDMPLVLWSVDSRDWESQPDYGNMQNILGRPMAAEEMRGIFLFHDTKIRTVRDIKLIITILRAMGCKQFVTVSKYLDQDEHHDILPDEHWQKPLIMAKPDLKNHIPTAHKNDLAFSFKLQSADDLEQYGIDNAVKVENKKQLPFGKNDYNFSFPQSLR